MESTNPEELFLRQLATIERAIGFACRRGKFYGADADDFASMVKLKLIENDYAILRKFEGRCSFHTYITIVVQRLLLDHRNHILGKWRPSAEAKRLGPHAVQLEELIVRDRLPMDDAMAVMRRTHPDLDRQVLESIAGRLPPRPMRMRAVELSEDFVETVAGGEGAETRIDELQRQRVERRVSACLRAAIEEIPENERLIFRLHFENGMTVAQIARALQVEQKPIYRQITRHLQRLRAHLAAAHLDEEVLADLRRGVPLNLDLGFRRDNDRGMLGRNSPDEGERPYE